MLEVAARSGFADAFTHVSERHARVEEFATSLCGALVAQACNIGFEPMVRTDQPALSRNRLSWVSQNFIRSETIAAANARIVAAQNALPIAHSWGSGEVASADGLRFVAPSSAVHAGPNPKYFGAGRGITYYNLVSDQFTGLNAIVVPGTLRDSLLILGLLLEQETDLEPALIMTDTAAYADTVFGLFWLLGYQFSPRLADIGDARFWRIDRTADYGALDGLARHRLDTELIKRNWEDLLRLAGSLKLGRIHAGAIMRVLQVKDRPTTLARALAELGRIVKTMHMLGLATHQFSHAAQSGGGGTSRCRQAWRRRMPRLKKEVRPRRRLRGCRSAAFFRPAWRRGPRPTSRSRPPRTGPGP
jgi:TnpA family transposase